MQARSGSIELRHTSMEMDHECYKTVSSEQRDRHCRSASELLDLEFDERKQVREDADRNPGD